MLSPQRIIKWVTKNRSTLILFLLPVLLTLIVFRKYILSGLLPIPGDIIPGLYFPWFDYKWGYETPIPVQNAAASDIVSILYPWRILAFRYLKDGVLPLWDPTILLGVPLLANFQTAFFNPINLLFLVFKEYHAWSLGVLFQPLLTFFLTYLFLRDIKFEKFPAMIGSILYSYSGYAIVWMEYNSINYTIAYFPAILLAARKIAKRLDIVWLFLLSTFVFLQFVSGYPQNALYTLAVSFLYFLYNLRNNNEIKIKTLLFFTSIIFGFMLSAVQLIPSLELQSLSIRNYDKVALAGDVKYLPLKNIITVFFPDYFGNPGNWNYFGIGSYDNFAFAISSVGMFFVIIALPVRSKYGKDYAFFLVLLLFTFLFSVNNLFSEWISNSKFLGFIAGSNTRILFIVSFVLSIFAAYGLQLLQKMKLKTAVLLVPALVYFIILSIHLLMLFVAMKNDTGQLLTAITNKYTGSDGVIINLIVSIRNMVIPASMVFVVTAFSLLRKKRVFNVVLVFCLFASIILSTDKYLSFIKRELLYPDTEVTEYLKENTKNSRFDTEKNNLIFPPNSWSLLGLISATGQNASGLLSTSRYLSLINYKAINDEIVTRYNRIENYNSPLINTLNISHVAYINWLNDSPDEKGMPNNWLVPDNFKEVKNIKTVRIYENINNLGIAWFPKQVICEQNDDIVYEKISSDKYESKDISYVNCDKGTTYKGYGTVKLIEVNPNKYVFESESNSDNYLIVSSSYYPGWKVKIFDTTEENNSSDVDKANGSLIAVKVPSGKHVIDLEYRPKSFVFGAFLTIASIILWIGIFFVKIKPKGNVFKIIFLKI